VIQILLLAYAAAAGFVAAGFLASLYQLLTNEPARFMVGSESVWAGLVAIAICVFAGPFILMRQAVRGRFLERRPIGWLAASTAIATGWSLCSGILMIQFAIVLHGSIG
jgi:hypothetical protein